jgi:hypothetical protein
LRQRRTLQLEKASGVILSRVLHIYKKLKLVTTWNNVDSKVRTPGRGPIDLWTKLYSYSSRIQWF